MQGALNGPRMDEDPVGPRHWAAGGRVGYKHGMRDGMRARGQDRGVARAAQQPLEIGKPRYAKIGLLTGCGKGERQSGVANRSEQKRLESESAKQQPSGMGKRVAIEW